MRVMVIGVLLASGCSAPVPPPTGLVPAELAAVADPVGAVRARLQAMEGLIEEQGARGELERLAREVVGLLAREVFDPAPLDRGRLRARVLFVTAPDLAMRRAALEESRSLLARIETTLEQASHQGGK